MQYLSIYWYCIQIHSISIFQISEYNTFVSKFIHSYFINFDWIVNGIFFIFLRVHSVQFSSVAQLCPNLCDPMNGSMPGLPVYHQLLEFTQTHVH